MATPSCKCCSSVSPNCNRGYLVGIRSVDACMELCNSNPCQSQRAPLIGNSISAAVLNGDTVAGTIQGNLVISFLLNDSGWKRTLLSVFLHRAHLKRLDSSFHVTLLRIVSRPHLVLKPIRLSLRGPLTCPREQR